jgi:hypothetical protein
MSNRSISQFLHLARDTVRNFHFADIYLSTRPDTAKSNILDRYLPYPEQRVPDG